ncbi:hypothetical protein [Mycobacterium pseudokansasii]|uniref:hypothetical protein n=1 Tax=Mycobacterium pseudokansasii TaxID=2341080 RepID=UPI001FEAA957|nr:hypothetical protein [Mycobacterium pseudokansasii]
MPPQVVPNTADRYQQGTYVEIAGADHLVFWGSSGGLLGPAATRHHRRYRGLDG